MKETDSLGTVEVPDSAYYGIYSQRSSALTVSPHTMAEVAPVGELAHELEGLYEGLVDRRYSYSPELSVLLMACHERLAQHLEELQHQQPLSDASELIAQLHALRHSSPAPTGERDDARGGFTPLGHLELNRGADSRNA